MPFGEEEEILHYLYHTECYNKGYLFKKKSFKQFPIHDDIKCQHGNNFTSH